MHLLGLIAKIKLPHRWNFHKFHFNISSFLFWKQCSKTPTEILHTILLGPIKYLLSATIQSLTREQKDQIHAKIASTDMSAFPANIRGNITRNYGSYVGRDFKLWIQVAVFILEGIVSEDVLIIWELLCEVLRHRIQLVEISEHSFLLHVEEFTMKCIFMINGLYVIIPLLTRQVALYGSVNFTFFNVS